ncbi:protein-tyrosine phosphatase-like protein [Cytidiella melzeri]|nr:protein-tyrosine phosphatase-like protein [Cytidiella melzeri]
MSSQSNPLPEWLERAQRPGYLAEVDKVLFERESKRSSSRRASRHRDHPSTTHRVLFKPATALKDSDVVEHYSVSHAYLPNNLPANRYIDVAPYDRTRVVVGHPGTEPAGRYLNASWVRELAGEKWWIATQAPLPGTVHAFLSLILQPVTQSLDENPVTASVTGSTSRIRTVVQLTRVRESGTQKAHFYFPQRPGESWISSPEPDCSAPPLKVTLIDTKHIEEAGCVQSTVSIQPVSGSGVPSQGEGDAVVFNHLFFEGWPDHDIPNDVDALVRFVHLVDELNRDVSSQSPQVQGKLDPDPPIMVGCSAGIGRTGTFIALSSILRAYHFLPASASLVHDGVAGIPVLLPSPLGELPGDMKDDMIALEVDGLREQRPGMVQKAAQMKLIYEVLMSLLADSHSLSRAVTR